MLVGCAFVKYETKEQAVAAIEGLNGKHKMEWSPDKSSVFRSSAEDGVLNIWDHNKVGILFMSQLNFISGIEETVPYITCNNDEAEGKKKKVKSRDMGVVPMQQLNHNIKNKEKLKAINTGVKPMSLIAQPDGSFSTKENVVRSTKDDELFLYKKNFSEKMKPKKKDDLEQGLLNKKLKILNNGMNIFKVSELLEIQRKMQERVLRVKLVIRFMQDVTWSCNLLMESFGYETYVVQGHLEFLHPAPFVQLQKLDRTCSQIPPPEKTKEEILLLFKLYDPLHQKKLYDPVKKELRYVRRLFVKCTGKPTEILSKLNELAGFEQDEEIQLTLFIFHFCHGFIQVVLRRQALMQNSHILIVDGRYNSWQEGSSRHRSSPKDGDRSDRDRYRSSRETRGKDKDKGREKKNGKGRDIGKEKEIETKVRTRRGIV
ncbi:transcription initiation factor TFIID subunit 1 isoform X1 [Tanacetum coccineum]|uniref:Transcription initiation factor TFIID subunit 1 isoform X1 n=1 Tax=Tanacetum coccineum TaxID=301880 RepID=A0ABQ5J9Y4_9ASTR